MSAEPIEVRQPPAAANAERRQLAEQIGTVMANWAPQSLQLIAGWLMVCTPPEQTQAEIRDAMGLSAGAVSKALRLLTDMQLVERVGPAADRTARYLLPRGAWLRALDYNVDMMARQLQEMRKSAKRVGAVDADARRNVEEFISYYDRMRQTMAETAEELRSP